MCGRVVSAAIVTKDILNRRASLLITKDINEIRESLNEDEKSIRVCLDCWRVVERQQSRVETPNYIYAYNEGINLEKELEILINNDNKINKAVILNKLQQLEFITQQFSTNNKLTNAIKVKFQQSLKIYLQYVKTLNKQEIRENVDNNNKREDNNEDRDLHLLQPLLEQQSQLESMINEANANRKFDDLIVLNKNLLEINAEINKIVK